MLNYFVDDNCRSSRADLKSSNENINEDIENEVNGYGTDKNGNTYIGVNNNNGIMSHGIVTYEELDHKTRLERKEDQYFSPKHKTFSNVNIQKQMARDQLIRLADRFGYEARFSDFPKVSWDF